MSPNNSHRHKYYSQPSQYTMSLPNGKSHRQVLVTQVSTHCLP